MKKLITLLAMMIALIPLSVSSQTPSKTIPRPKVVIGVVVDQMRWDYLYKFYHQYGDNGFKRLLSGGYVCNNAMVNYLPSHTSPGHSSIFTGSVPAISGITGNAFVANSDGILHEAPEDNDVQDIGSSKKGNSSSPKNLLVTTMTDELRIATNMKARTYSIGLKGRASVFPAGHLGNGAYWYSAKNAGWTSSTYYMKELPGWLTSFNSKHYPDSLTQYGWNLTGKDYSLSLPDNAKYEAGFGADKIKTFPHDIKHIDDVKERGEAFMMTSFGNTYTVMMARALIEGEKLGMNGTTDFLAISFSSPDLLGHQFGPNSMEMQEMFITFDRDIAGFLSYLDKTYGAGNYLMFLTADHGGSHNGEYLQDINVPGGVFSGKTVPEVNNYLKGKFGQDSIVIAFTNYYHFHLNNPLLESKKLDRKEIREAIIEWAQAKPEVMYAIDLYDINNTNMPAKIKDMVFNGYYKPRGGDVQLILNTGWYEYAGKTTGNTHGSWSPVDCHIPLIFYGWNIKPGETSREVYTTDIAPTISSLLKIQMPNGCIGKPITEVTK